MTTSELIATSYLLATGEVSTLSSSDSDWQKLLGYANLYIDNWANEPGVDWASLYDPAVAIGTVSATDSYDLDDSIRTISNQPDDYVQVTRLDGWSSSYSTVPPKDLKRFVSGNYCAKVGTTLRFNKPFTADMHEFGGTITIPAYLYPDHLVRDNDSVPVDNPNWLVFMLAAKWVQNDVTLAQNYPQHLSEAADVMKAMKQNNNAQIDTVSLGPVGGGASW